MYQNLFLKRYCTYPIWNKQYKLHNNPFYMGGNGIIYNTGKIHSIDKTRIKEAAQASLFCAS